LGGRNKRGVRVPERKKVVGSWASEWRNGRKEKKAKLGYPWKKPNPKAKECHRTGEAIETRNFSKK